MSDAEQLEFLRHFLVMHRMPVKKYIMKPKNVSRRTDGLFVLHELALSRAQIGEGLLESQSV
jgi:hypothetical protein